MVGIERVAAVALGCYVKNVVKPLTGNSDILDVEGLCIDITVYRVGEQQTKPKRVPIWRGEDIFLAVLAGACQIVVRSEQAREISDHDGGGAGLVAIALIGGRDGMWAGLARRRVEPSRRNRADLGVPAGYSVDGPVDTLARIVIYRSLELLRLRKGEGTEARSDGDGSVRCDH